MKGIGKIFETKYGGLIFSLISGTAYYIIILSFIVKYTHQGGSLLGFFFLPAIICGMALMILKAIRRMKDEEKFSQINYFIFAHLLLIIISIVFLIDIIL